MVFLLGRCVLTAAGCNINVYNTETSKLARQLCGHTGRVTAARINPDNGKQLFTASLDGTVILWDYTCGVQLRHYTFGAPVIDLLILQDTQTDAGIQYFVVLQRKDKDDAKQAPDTELRRIQEDAQTPRQAQPQPAGYLHSCPDLSKYDRSSLTKDGTCKQQSLQSACKRCFGKRCTRWDVDPRGQYIAGCSDTELCVWQPRGATKLYTARIGGRVSCIACHPTENTVAVGDTRGRIVLWQGLGTHKADAEPVKPVRTTLHWHAHGVSALAFTSEGSYLLSGGTEAVLVIWQLATGLKRFLPRLCNAPFLAIGVSGNDAQYVTAHMDNSINVVDALSLEINASFRGLRNCTVRNSELFFQTCYP